VILQVGNTESILFKDPAAQRHFNQIRHQNEKLLDELEKAGSPVRIYLRGGG